MRRMIGSTIVFRARVRKRKLSKDKKRAKLKYINLSEKNKTTTKYPKKKNNVPKLRNLIYRGLDIMCQETDSSNTKYTATTAHTKKE